MNWLAGRGRGRGPARPPDPGLQGISRPLPVPPEIVALCERFRAHGHALVLVGGSVRDLLLGRQPSQGWDLGTSATIWEVSKICPGARIDDISHTEFSLALATHEGFRLEVTPFRERHDFQRLADVHGSNAGTRSTLAQDLGGRDLTVNALAYDPVAGELYDAFNGLGDLERSVIRALPGAEERFRYDPIRILRAVRLAQKLGFEIEPSTWSSMRALSPEAEYDARRGTQELLRILSGERAGWGLARLRELDALEKLCPELTPCSVLRDPWDVEFTLYERLEQVLERLAPSSAPEALSVLAATCASALVAHEPDDEARSRSRLQLLQSYDAIVQRLLGPMLEDDDDWWVVSFGMSQFAFRSELERCDGLNAALFPFDVHGWPRVADAWWRLRAGTND